jgi:2-polyprenyl-6-methoxyphenol hydroxylase-like FAD-dependent oxidoreductase
MGGEDNSHRTQVLIVGGGPVGMLLALFLDRYGVKSVIFNTDDGVPSHPRGSTHNSRTMEHYRRLGISGTIRELGLPPDHPMDVAYFTRLSGWEIARYRMPSGIELARLRAAAQATDQIPEPTQRADQIRIAGFLRKHLGTRSNVELRFGWQADQFSQDADSVALMARCVTDGQTEQWRARYLVGCDGGHSDVRHSLGIRYSGYERLEQAYLGGRMISTYLRAPTLYRSYLGRRRAGMYWVVNPELRSTLFTLDGKNEFMFYTKPKHPDGLPDDAAVRHALFGSIGAEVPVEFIGHQPWTAGAALVAERFADRRIILAGDAVHLFTPTGGFGMNTGIDDVANLSWKLAATLRGWGGKSLLDSYESERKPIAVRNTRAARAIAKQVGSLDIPVGMEEDSPTGAEQRQEVGAQVSAYLATQFAPIGVELGARYDGSTIVASDEAAPTDSIVQYIPTGQPGGRAPHSWLGAGRSLGDSLYDRLGNCFTLLRLGPNPADGAGLAEAAKKAGVPLDILEVTDAATRDLYGADLVVVRPDQHIAWRGAKSPSDASAIVARVIGA